MSASEYDLTEEHEMIRDTVRKFATDRVEEGAIERDASGEPPADLLDAMAELALFAIPVPEEAGGAGLDTLAYALALEELAAVDASLALILFSHLSLGLLPIVEHGSDEQRSRHVERLATGERLAALALPAPLDLTPGSPRVGGSKEGDGWRLSGGPLFAVAATRCGVLLVPAGPEDGSAGIFLVEADADGVSVGDAIPTLGCRAADIRPVSFEEVAVGDDARLGDDANTVLRALGDSARIGVAAMAVGIARGVLDKAIPYARERTAFGKPISRFAGVGHRLADMATETHAARLLVYAAARTRDAGGDPSRAASMAALFASEAAERASDHAIQVLGGYGYSREYHVERFYRDAKLLTLGGLGAERERSVLAESLTAD